MKEKLSISIDHETIEHIKRLLVDGHFRNVSHAIEFAVNHFFSEVQDGKRS